MRQRWPWFRAKQRLRPRNLHFGPIKAENEGPTKKLWPFDRSTVPGEQLLIGPWLMPFDRGDGIPGFNSGFARRHNNLRRTMKQQAVSRAVFAERLQGHRIRDGFMLEDIRFGCGDGWSRAGIFDRLIFISAGHAYAQTQSCARNEQSSENDTHVNLSFFETRVAP